MLSPSTEDYDRGGKFELVQQHMLQENGDWLMRSHSDPLGSFRLHSLPQVELSMAEIYRRVDWS